MSLEHVHYIGYVNVRTGEIRGVDNLLYNSVFGAIKASSFICFSWVGFVRVDVV